MTIEETAGWLQAHDRFLILTHVRPDGDTVGCAAALCGALRQIGKTAYVLANPELTATCADYVTCYHAPEDYIPECIVSTDVASLGLLPENAAPYRKHIDLAIDHHPLTKDLPKLHASRAIKQRPVRSFMRWSAPWAS